MHVSPAGESLFFSKKKSNQKKLALAGSYPTASGRKLISFRLLDNSKVALLNYRLPRWGLLAAEAAEG